MASATLVSGTFEVSDDELLTLAGLTDLIGSHYVQSVSVATDDAGTDRIVTFTVQPN